MKTSLLLRLALCAAAGLACASAQNNDQPPKEAFQAVHLVNLDAAAEKAVAAAFADINAAIAKGGCAKCAYHLWKVFGTQAGSYDHLWISSWPSGDVYAKVHNSKPYQDAITKHKELDPIMEKQVYNRYVEVK